MQLRSNGCPQGGNEKNLEMFSTLYAALMRHMSVGQGARRRHS